jgi:hypothetical protein
VNDTSTSDERPEAEAPPAPAAEPARSFLPSSAAGRTRLAAAGIAGVFFLTGGIGGYAIGQANDSPDEVRIRPADFDGGRGGPGGGPGQMPGGPGSQQRPTAPDGGSTDGSADSSST